MNGDISDPDDFHNEADSFIGDDQLQFIAMSRGYWGNNTRVAIVDQTTQVQALSGNQGTLSDDLYNVINAVDSPLADEYSMLVIVQNKAQGSSTYETAEVFNVSTEENSVDDQGRTNFIEKKINDGGSDYIRVVIGESYKDMTVPTD